VEGGQVLAHLHLMDRFQVDILDDLGKDLDGLAWPAGAMTGVGEGCRDSEFLMHLLQDKAASDSKPQLKA
jgi:hypothetical protein